MSILECRNLRKSYGSKTALDDISLCLETGHIVGLLGPNGSGKTTLIKLLNGLLTPNHGEILVDGKKPSSATKAVVSYLPERIALPAWMTIGQAVRYYADFYADFDANTAEDMLGRLGLDPTARIKTLSKGTKEKLQLILVMSRRAKLFVLDEPLGGVDPVTRDYILRTIIGNYNPEATVLLSTHLITDVEPILDEVIFLREGHIELHDSVENLRRERGMSINELFREVFQC